MIFGLTLRADGDPQTYDLLQGRGLPSTGIEFPDSPPLEIRKDSQIGPYLATQTTRLHPTEGLTVTANLTLAYGRNATMHVNFLYTCMSMFALRFTRWVAQTANGTMVAGLFASDGSFSLHEDIRWAAVVDDSTLDGAVFQFPNGHAYHGAGTFKNSFWNRAYDHKLYLRIDPPKTVGEATTIRHSIRHFRADSLDTWVAAARKQVRGWPTRPYM